MNNINKENIIGNIIGLNPTGTIEFNGTFQMNGNNNIIQTPVSASKENLIKSQNNQIVCENFNNNYSKYDEINSYKEDNFNKYIKFHDISGILVPESFEKNFVETKNNSNKKYILLLILFLIIFIIYLLL